MQCCIEASSFVFRSSRFDLSTFPVKLINLVTLKLVVIIKKKNAAGKVHLTATDAGSLFLKFLL